MDYVLFVSGLAYLLLASASLLLSDEADFGRSGGKQGVLPLDWSPLVVFAACSGLTEWLDALAVGLGDTKLFFAVRALSQAAAYVLLFEFARRNLAWTMARPLWKSYLLPVVVVGCTLALIPDVRGLRAAVGAGFGAFGAWATAWIFWRTDVRMWSAGMRRHFHAIAWIWVAYALVYGVCSISWEPVLFKILGVPAPFARMIVSALLGMGMLGLLVPARALSRATSFAWLVSFLGIAILGGFGTTLVTRFEESQMRRYLQSAAKTVSAISAEMHSAGFEMTEDSLMRVFRGVAEREPDAPTVSVHAGALPLLTGKDLVVSAFHPIVLHGVSEPRFLRLDVPRARWDRQILLARSAAILLTLIGGVGLGTAFVRNIRERRQRRVFEQTEARLRLMAQNTREVVWQMDANLVFEYVSPSDFDIRGYSMDEIIGRSLWDFLTPRCRERVGAEIRRRQSSLAPGERLGPGTFVTEQLCKDGSTIWTEIISNPIYSSDGVLLGFQGVSRDVTERKRAEEELQKSEERFRRYVMSSPMAFFICDRQGRYVFVNEAACRLTGFSESELLTMSIAELTHPDVVEHDISAFAGLMQAGKIHTEITLRHKSGRAIYAIIDAVTHDDQSFLGYCTDITARREQEREQKRMQTQLFHSAKLASIGTMAAGIAHEINNPLAVLAGSGAILRNTLEQADLLTPDVREMLDRQDVAVDRITRIVKGLRIYSRSDTDMVEQMDLHRLIPDTTTLVQPILRRAQLELVLELGCSDPVIQSNAGKLQQVLMNLLINARDALEGRENRRVVISTSDDGAFVEIRVRDNGPGIDAKHLPHLFDPFFTTKPPGKGTGLGLSISHSIIESLGGVISAENSPEGGAVFVIRLPRAGVAATSVVKPAEKTADEGFPQLSGRALVVDDEAPVRQVLATLLRRMGVDVSESEDGKAALILLEKDRFDLLITDLKMPGMGGESLIRRAAQIPSASNTRFIAVTGGAGTINERMVDGLLLKPFTPETLASAIREALEPGVPRRARS